MHCVYERELEKNIYTPNRKAGLGLHPETPPQADPADWSEFVYFLRSHNNIKTYLN